MILDFSKGDLDVVNQHEIIDLRTDRPLSMEPPYDLIWLADDEKNIIRYYLKNSLGDFLLAREEEPSKPLWDEREVTKFDSDGIPAPAVCVAWCEEKMPIKIVKKSDVGV